MKTNRRMAVLLVGVALSLGACKIEKKSDGAAPTVDVNAGRLPDYDVDAARIDVKGRAAEVTVPDIDVHTEKKTVIVPDIDVTMPSGPTTGREDEAAPPR